MLRIAQYVCAERGGVSDMSTGSDIGGTVSAAKGAVIGHTRWGRREAVGGTGERRKGAVIGHAQ